MFSGKYLLILALVLIIIFLVVAILVLFWVFKKRMEMDITNQALRKYFRDGQ